MFSSKYFLLKPGINLNKNSVWLSDPSPSHINHTNLDFDAKHLKRSWKRGAVNFVVPFFSKKVPFLVNIGCCPDILDRPCKLDHPLIITSCLFVNFPVYFEMAGFKYFKQLISHC